MKTYSATIRNGRGNDINFRPALLQSVVVREQMALLRSAEDLAYARFDYTISRPVARVEQRWPDLTPEAPKPVPADYWATHALFAPREIPVARTHLGCARLRAGTLHFGDEALKRAAQARVRELMAARADARRAEWHALAGIAA